MSVPARPGPRGGNPPRRRSVDGDLGEMLDAVEIKTGLSRGEVEESIAVLHALGELDLIPDDNLPSGIRAIPRRSLFRRALA